MNSLQWKNTLIDITSNTLGKVKKLKNLKLKLHSSISCPLLQIKLISLFLNERRHLIVTCLKVQNFSLQVCLNYKKRLNGHDYFCDDASQSK